MADIRFAPIAADPSPSALQEGLLKNVDGTLKFYDGTEFRPINEGAFFRTAADYPVDDDPGLEPGESVRVPGTAPGNSYSVVQRDAITGDVLLQLPPVATLGDLEIDAPSSVYQHSVWDARPLGGGSADAPAVPPQLQKSSPGVYVPDTNAAIFFSADDAPTVVQAINEFLWMDESGNNYFVEVLFLTTAPYLQVTVRDATRTPVDPIDRLFVPEVIATP